jgi:hypothetical protein
MPGRPRPGAAYRQEYYPRHAEDQARVLAPVEPRTSPPAHTAHTVIPGDPPHRGDEPPDRPRGVERKEYVAGVGDVKEQTIRGDRQRIALVSVTR